MKKTTLLLQIGIMLLLGCNADIAQGPGSETVALAGQAVYETGEKAAGCRVVLRSKDFLISVPEQEPQNGSETETITDDLGRFEIDSVFPGEYSLVISDEQSKAVLLPCTVGNQNERVEIPAGVLKPTSNLNGKVALPADYDGPVYVRIYGLDSYYSVDADEGTYTLTDIPEGIHEICVTIIKTGTLFSDVQSITVPSGSTVDAGTMNLNPHGSSSFSRTIGLNTTSTGAAVAENALHFPILLRLDETNFDFSQAAPDGRDIRFTKQDGTFMHYEIERWDTELKTAEVWVLADTVYGDDSTQFFTMHWGDTTLSSPESGAVFDTARGYEGVWHLCETEPPVVFDATANGLHGQTENIRESFTSVGAIGVAKPFNGGTTYIQIAESHSGKLDFSEHDSFSISAWVYLDTLDGLYHQIVSKGNQQYGLQVHEDGSFEFFSFSETNGWSGVRAPAQAGKWKFVTGVKDGPDLRLYIDGILASEEIIARADHSHRDTGYDLYIGRRADIADRFWKGSIDEVRISSEAKNSSWVKLEYMNQSFPDLLTKFK
ncbi:MAG: DUF2341 domain-containing protein [Chitinispirillaceae bacterium]